MTEPAAATAPDVIPIDSSETQTPYIQTTTGNWVSRKAIIEDARHVEFKGRSLVHAGTLFKSTATGWIRTGRYCHVGAGTTIESAVLPLHHQVRRRQDASPDEVQYGPVTIGAHTCIGEDCHLQAAAVGSFVGWERVLYSARE
jgi:dynactin-5